MHARENLRAGERTGRGRKERMNLPLLGKLRAHTGRRARRRENEKNYVHLAEQGGETVLSQEFSPSLVLRRREGGEEEEREKFRRMRKGGDTRAA